MSEERWKRYFSGEEYDEIRKGYEEYSLPACLTYLSGMKTRPQSHPNRRFIPPALWNTKSIPPG